MKMPGGEAAIVDRVKLTEYCLNPEHPRGKHKARVFAAALGFTAGHADELRTALLTAPRQRTLRQRHGTSSALAMC